MERVYKAGPRCQQLGQTFGLGFKPDPRDLCQIFTRSEIRARIAYSTISDAIIAVRLEWEGLTIC